jgi:hypothetical protein
MAYYDWTVPVRSLIHRLQKHDFVFLSVNDGEEDLPVISDPGSLAERNEVTEAITSVDASYVRIGKGSKFAILFIVLGNEPDELVCDYSYSDDELGNELDDAIDAFRNQWEGKKCPLVEDVV